MAVLTGHVMARAIRGMRHAVAALAGQGSDLLVNDVMFDPAKAAEYRAILAHANLRSSDCSPRWRRASGSAATASSACRAGRWIAYIAYDLEIDTSAVLPAECAACICEAFDLDTGSTPRS